MSCQIFFSDPNKLREETGLTQGWWENGICECGHRIDPKIGELFPCFYGGGGSCAYDRGKFLELGGFDELSPVLPGRHRPRLSGLEARLEGPYQPPSVVYHEHRGTIGKRFSQSILIGPQEEFHPVLLEEYSRVAPAKFALLLYVGGGR